MRSMFTLIALALFAGGAAAAEPETPPQKFFLVDGKVTTESRVSELEKEVAALKAEVAKLKGAPAAQNAARSACGCASCTCQPHAPGTPWNPADNCGSYACPANGGAKAAATFVGSDGVLYQMCADGWGRPVAGYAPSFAPSPFGTFAAPACSGPNCKIR